MLNFFLKSLAYMPFVIGILGITFTFVAHFHFFQFLRLSYRKIMIALFILYPLYAFVLSVTQYYIWSQNSFTKIFLSIPVSPETPVPIYFEPLRLILDSHYGYFVFYSLGRFWTSAILSIITVSLLYFILSICEYYLFSKKKDIEISKDHEDDDTELSRWRNIKLLFCIGALSVGWPKMLISILLSFLFLFFSITIFSTYFKKESKTALFSILLASLITILFGTKLIILLQLGVLKI